MTMQLSVQEPARTRDDLVNDVFERNGKALSLRDLAKACVSEGVWSQDELNAIVIKSVMEACRRVLNKKDEAGLPKNGPTTETDGDGAPVWKARQIWLFPDYERNVREHVQQRDENHIVALRLAEEAEDRFGHRIDIPDVTAAV